jgi:integrase
MASSSRRPRSIATSVWRLSPIRPIACLGLKDSRPAPLLRLDAIAASLNPTVIQARLGHATITETMNSYGHILPDEEGVGREAIDAIFAAAVTEQERNQEIR